MLILKDKMRDMMKLFVCILCFFSSITFADTLFVCTEDVNRCYIAQVVASLLLYHPSEVKALNRTFFPDEKATQVLNAWNIQEPQSVESLDTQALSKADLVLTMTQKEKIELIRSYPQFSKKIATLSQCATGKNVDIASLKEKDLKAYEATRNLIFQYEDMISVRGWHCDALSH